MFNICNRVYKYINKINLFLFILYRNIKVFFWFKVLPYKIILKLNDNCNLKCSFCNIWKNKVKSILKKELYFSFIKEYWKNIKILSFTWWEIFLLKNLNEIIFFAIKNCKKLNIFSFTTNWFFSDKILKLIEKILKKEKYIIIIINISIDWNKELHNKLRWNSFSFQKANYTYNKLKKLEKKYHNLQVNQEFLLNSENSNLLKQKIRKKNIVISIAQNSFYYNKNDIKQVDFNITKKDIKSTKNFFNDRFLKWYLRKNYNCYAINSSLFINYNGDVLPCINWNKKLWNIKNENIYKIIKWIKSNKNLEKIKQKKCPTCWTPCDWYLSIIHQFRKNIF